LIPQSEFNLALAVVLHAIPDEKPSMPAICSLLMEFTSDREMRLIGTDGEVIVVCCLELEHLVPAGAVFRIDKEDTGRLVADFPADSTERITLCIFGETLIVTAGAKCASMENLPAEPTYPNYRKAMTYKQCPSVARPFDLHYLHDALAALAPLCDLVSVDINGLLGPGYIDAVIPEGQFECLRSVRIGIDQRRGV
jgi:hypothetical protein